MSEMMVTYLNDKADGSSGDRKKEGFAIYFAGRVDKTWMRCGW